MVLGIDLRGAGPLGCWPALVFLRQGLAHLSRLHLNFKFCCLSLLSRSVYRHEPGMRLGNLKKKKNFFFPHLKKDWLAKAPSVNWSKTLAPGFTQPSVFLSEPGGGVSRFLSGYHPSPPPCVFWASRTCWLPSLCRPSTGLWGC